MNGNQSISNTTYTKLEMDTEVYDSDGTYDHSTNYRFTPGVAGKYFCYAKIRWDTGTDIAAAILAFYKNIFLLVVPT